MQKFMKFYVLAAVMLAAYIAAAQGLGGGARERLRNPRRPAGQTAASDNPAFGNDRTPQSAQLEKGTKSIVFKETEISLVFQVYGELTGKTVLIDPKAPKPAITLQPRQDQILTDEEKIFAVETVLEMNGIHLEPYGEKFVRAIPR